MECSHTKGTLKLMCLHIDQTFKNVSQKGGQCGEWNQEHKENSRVALERRKEDLISPRDRKKGRGRRMILTVSD